MIEENNLDDRIIDVNTIEQKENFQISLRPKRLSEFIGQPQVQKNLSTFISAAISIGVMESL